MRVKGNVGRRIKRDEEVVEMGHFQGDISQNPDEWVSIGVYIVEMETAV